MWYNRLSEYLIKEGYVNNLVCPCIFIENTTSRFVIITVYIDVLNIIRNKEEIRKSTNYLKKEFKMKDLG